MAVVLEQTEVQIEWRDLLSWKPPTQIQRQEEEEPINGVRLTSILRYLHFGSLPLTATDKEKEKKKSEWDIDDPDVMPLRMAMGMAWEWWVAGHYPDIHYSPGAMSEDGIVGHPDWLENTIFENGWWTVDECKLTWKSCRTREILKEHLWMWQLKGYCYLTRTRYGQMHVGWVNGDYSFPHSPRYMKYLIEFEQEELERNWNMLVVNRDKSIEWNLTHRWNGREYALISGN